MRDLCPPHATPPHGNARHSQVPSGISASRLDSSDGHGHPTPPPCPAQTGVCPRPTFTPQTTVVRVAQGRTATVPVAVIPPHSLDAENAFSEGKEDPPHSSWARSPETPARVQNKNVSADLSPCNGISAILGQHEACPERDDSERTRPATTPSIRTFQSIHRHFVPLTISLNDYDPSLTYISDDVVLFWQPPSVFSQWIISTFTVDRVDYTCAEQYMMASKARLIGDDSGLSAILVTDDPREQKRIGRQVRSFDQDLWQKYCENIVFDGNLAKVSQNEDIRRALLHTSRRRLAEASPHDNLWGIGLRACVHHASSTDTWRGSNLLGEILEHVRETLDRETMQQSPDPLPPDTAKPVNHPSDTIFEVDPATRIRLNTARVGEDPHNAILSALIDSVPDDHVPEVLLTYGSHTDKALKPEQGPDLVSGTVTIDDDTFTTLPSLTSGASATSPFRCRALLDTGSPQSFIHQGSFDQMVATGVADESYVRATTSRSWSGFGSQELLSTNRRARIHIQFYPNNTPSASLAVWMYIVPVKTMRCPVLLGRDSWMRFHTRSHQTLAPTHDGRIFGELTLSHTFSNAHNSAAAYIHSCETLDAAHHLIYDGQGMTLTTAPQLVPVNLVRLDGSPALTGQYMVDTATTHDGKMSLRTFRSFRSTNDPSHGPSSPRTWRHFRHCITPTSTRTLGDLGATRHTA